MSRNAELVPNGRLPQALARRLEVGTVAFAVVALAATVIAYAVDAPRFSFSYLVGFAWAATVTLGGLLFVLLQHLTRAGWSSSARRQMEWLSSALPLVALLFVPLAFLAPHIYEWMSPEALLDPLVAKKHAYLNAPAFLVRAGVFFAVWSFLAWKFARTSRAQDHSANPEIETAKMGLWSAPSIIAVGLTLSFAGFDWLMSLDPRWYSTIFGVYVIAGSLVAGLSALALLSIALERRGVLGGVSTVEHRHDIGKLLFGFTVFWAYIAFCQYFLIWYAGLPEETIFFRHRWVGSWQNVSVLLVAGHFVVPFMLLLSRHGKRNVTVLATSATLLLCMHYVDLYWLVMPTLDKLGAQPSWIDLAGLALPAAVLALWMARRAAREPAYCIRDPRLPEALRLENF